MYLLIFELFVYLDCSKYTNTTKIWRDKLVTLAIHTFWKSSNPQDTGNRRRLQRFAHNNESDSAGRFSRRWGVHAVRKSDLPHALQMEETVNVGRRRICRKRVRKKSKCSFRLTSLIIPWRHVIFGFNYAIENGSWGDVDARLFQSLFSRP